MCRGADGEVIAGPLYDQEGVVVADCDLRRALHAKRYFDAAGHYSRADVLTPIPRRDVAGDPHSSMAQGNHGDTSPTDR